ncbi:MAG: ATP-dependent Clp protease proteolytic subunit, partial [Oscillospiraceae bacterium]|nr:ATP-dependent Clp protease proteolytic subunit [Oscillospiraceae bacterium]
ETIKARMNQILADNTGKSLEEVTAACERDNFMSAEEAMQFGLIDKIIANKKKSEPTTAQEPNQPA